MWCLQDGTDTSAYNLECDLQRWLKSKIPQYSQGEIFKK